VPWGGTATPRAVPTCPRFRAAAVEVVTTSDGVHRHGTGGAPSGAVRCHCRFSTENRGRRGGHRLGTTVPRVVHRPIFLEGKGFAGLAWVVTATPRAMPPPPLSGDQ